MRLYLTLFLLFQCSIFCFAQSINGSVTSLNNEAIEFANVVAKTLTGEILEVVTTQENGLYEMKVDAAQVVVECYMLGYEDFKSDTLSLSSSEVLVYDILMTEESSMLDEIVIKTTRPKITQQGGKTIVNFENTLQSGSSLDGLLKKVPGVIVANNKVRVGASTTAKILINGRNTNFMDMETLLREMPAENISRIEVVTQPDASYEASGSGPLINVILKRNKLKGNNGSISSMIGKNEDWTYSTGVRLSSFLNNVNISGGLSFRQSSYLETLDLTRRLPGNTFVQQNSHPFDPITIRGNVDMDYYINEKHALGFSVYRSQSRQERAGSSTIEIFQNEVLGSFLETTTRVEDDWNYWKINPYYEWRWDDEKDEYLRFDVRYIDFDSKDNTVFVVNEISNYPYQNSATYQDGAHFTLSGKVDYLKSINDKNSFKMGLQYDHADIDNYSKFFTADFSGTIDESTQQNNDFLITEDIWAGYAQYNWSSKPFHFSTGLRYEDSFTEGYSVQLDTTSSRDIAKLFPNASLTYELNKHMSLVGAYSYRIQRPGYFSLNPFQVFFDPITRDSGNPNLAPEYTHSSKFSFLYDNNPAFSIEYKTTKDAIFQGVFQNDLTGDAFRKNVNVDERKTFQAQIFGPLGFLPLFDGFGGFIISNTAYTSTLSELEYNKSKWNVTWYHQLTAQLPADINMEWTLWAGNGALEDLIEAKWFAGTYVEFSKHFLDKKLKVALELSDLIPRGFNANISYSQLDADIISEWHFLNINLRANYRFGTNFINTKKKKKSASEGLERLQG